MRIVAITGRSGSGKSSITRHYAAQGYPTVDADALAREVAQPQSACLQELTQAFGKDILQADGTLNRKKLASIAFATPEGTEKLTHITHPYILNSFLQKVESAQKEGHLILFVDGAVIVGGIFEKYCDKIMLVVTENEIAVQRIMQRDHLTREAAIQRLDAQMSEAVLRDAADYILSNNTTEKALLQEADGMLQHILKDIEGGCEH